jgi:hypothetical protein
MKKLICILLLVFPVVAFSQQPWYKSSPLDYMWLNVGNAGFSAGQALYISLACNPSGQPYVAYKDNGNSGRLTVVKFDGTNWVNVGNAGFSLSVVTYTSLAFSPSGQPYVAYSDGSNSNKATVIKYDGNNWIYVGNAGFSPAIAIYTSIAFNPTDGYPYVAYGDAAYSYNSSVMKFDGTSWVNVGNAGFSAGEADNISLAFSPSGQPYVAYMDLANSLKATLMKFDSVFTGINEPQESRLSLYPNPASDKITIEKSPIPAQSQLFIMNVNGQKLITQHISERKTVIDISTLPSGVYFVRVTNDRTVEVGKIIKQ